MTLAGDAGTLPAGFEQVEPWVAEWVLPDAQARMAKRQSGSMEQLKGFYEAMLPFGEAALAHLRELRLGDLPPESERLLKLMLALAEVAPAVEWYGQPRVPDGFPIERIRYVRQISDAGPQV